MADPAPGGLRVEVVRDWDGLELESLRPFVAYIGGRFAGHAIVVRPLVDGTFLVIDPADGERIVKTEERIREIWDRIAVRVAPIAQLSGRSSYFSDDERLGTRSAFRVGASLP